MELKARRPYQWPTLFIPRHVRMLGSKSSCHSVMIPEGTATGQSPLWTGSRAYSCTWLFSVSATLRQVTLRPGGTVEVLAQVDWRSRFKGRVPIEVQYLPYRVRVRDVGLNGVLITEQQTSRRFVITAEPRVKPQTRPFFAVGRVESVPFTEIASEPIVLTVAPATARASR